MQNIELEFEEITNVREVQTSIERFNDVKNIRKNDIKVNYLDYLYPKFEG